MSDASGMREFLRRNETLLWLALIVLIAALVRLNGFATQSYWYDELFSAHISNPGHSLGEVIRLTLADVHPPLFQIVMWWSYKLLGYNEVAGRLPSLLAGIATIPVIYLLGRDLLNSRVGLYAAALAIPNVYLVYYSQEARSYAFLYLLCSLSFLFFLRALRSESRVNVALYIVSTIALLYTHYYVFVALAAQGVILLVCLAHERVVDKALLARAGVAVGVVLLAVLPLVPSIASHSSIDEFWITQPGSTFVVTFFIGYFGSVLLAAVFALLVLTGLSNLLPGRDRSYQFAAMALLVWIVVGYLVPWLRGLVAQPILTDRNTVMLVPPILLLSAMGLVRLAPLWLQRGAGCVLLAYSCFHIAVVLDYDGSVSKAQYRQMAQALGEFDSSLPVYTLKFHDTKYNVYFEQQKSGLHAEDAVVLDEKLSIGVAPALFWLADGHGRLLETDIDDRFGLIEVARYRFRGAVAVLLVNPAASAQLPLSSARSERAGYATWVSNPFSIETATRMLVAAVRQEDVETREPVFAELLDVQGTVLATAAIDLDAMDTALKFAPGVPDQDGARIRVSLPEGFTDPKAWILEAAAGQ